jgi:hypothetical protein
MGSTFIARDGTVLRTVADGGRTSGTGRTPAAVRSLVRAGLVIGFAGLTWLLTDATATAVPSPSVSEPALVDPAAGSVPAVPGTATFGTEAMEAGALAGGGPTFGRDTILEPWPASSWRDVTEPDGTMPSTWGGPGSGGSGWTGLRASGSDPADPGADWARVWTGVATAGQRTGWPTAGQFLLGGATADGDGAVAGADGADDGSTGAVPAAQPDTTTTATDDPAAVTTAPEVDTSATTSPRGAAPGNRRHGAAGDRPALLTDTVADSLPPADAPPPGPPSAPLPTPMGGTGTGGSSGTNPQLPVATVTGGPAGPTGAPVRARIDGLDHEAPVWRPGRATPTPD